MSTETFANPVSTSLSAGISSSDTTLTVASASGFPTSGAFRIRIDDEILIVSGVSGTTWTVGRGVESTVAASHGAKAVVKGIVTSGAVSSLLAQKYTIGSYASRPAAGTPGRMYIANDAPLKWMDNGVGWDLISPVYVPSSGAIQPGTFTFLTTSSGTYTSTDLGGVLSVTMPAGPNVECDTLFFKSIPYSPPYTITGYFASRYPTYDYGGAGLLLRNSSTTQIKNLHALDGTGGGVLRVTRADTNGTSNGASYANVAFRYDRYIGVRVSNDGVNLKFYYSTDTANWILLNTQAYNDTFTVDQYGFLKIGISSQTSHSGLFFGLNIVNS